MIVLDTGVLFAAADRRDRDHGACVAVLDAHPSSELVLPGLVAAETSWLIGDRLGAETEATFVASVATGDFVVDDLTATDWRRAAELLERYTDLGLGLIDAAVITIAERLGVIVLAKTGHGAGAASQGARRARGRVRVLWGSLASCRWFSPAGRASGCSRSRPTGPSRRCPSAATTA